VPTPGGSCPRTQGLGATLPQLGTGDPDDRVPGQYVEVRGTLVAVVLASAVLGAGCSSQSQPSATQTAKKQVQFWLAADQADLRTLRAECPTSSFSCEFSSPAGKKVLADEGHLARAELALERAEGQRVQNVPGATRIYFPSTG